MAASGFPLPYRVPFAGIALVTAAGLGVGAVAVVYPAARAARLDVVRALRWE